MRDRLGDVEDVDALLEQSAGGRGHQQDHSPEAVAARLGISVVGRHTALGDALVTAEVFVALTALLRKQGVEHLGEALDLARRTYEARVDRRLYKD